MTSNKRKSNRLNKNSTNAASSVREYREVTHQKRNNNHINLDEIVKLATKKKRLSNNCNGNQGKEMELDDNSNTDCSESNEEDAMSDITPNSTDLKLYFLENYDMPNKEKRLVNDMDRICTNQSNDRSFLGMCEALVKLHKMNNVLKQKVLQMKNKYGSSTMKHMEKVADLKAFLKEKTVNLFRHKFIMVSS